MFTEIENFVGMFGKARWRRPVLLIIGATNLGKSMLAANVLDKVAQALGMDGGSFVEITVEDDNHIDFSDFDASVHSGVLLDGVSDVLLLKTNREALQGRPKMLKGARSATMKFSYPYSLARRAIVVTMDLSAENMHLLTSDDWLSDVRNVVQLRLSEFTCLVVSRL